MLLNKRFDIGTVICAMAVVLARGRGQITVPISNLFLMTTLLHNYSLYKRKVSKGKNPSELVLLNIYYWPN